MLKAAMEAGVYIQASCGGEGVCGKCQVRIEQGEVERTRGAKIYIDIGTNGEIVIGNSEWMVTAACSAGPAFEGGGIKHGMRATLGAIEDFRLNPVTFEPMLLTIGMVKPKGICGSGSPQRSQSTQRRFRKKLYSIFF